MPSRSTATATFAAGSETDLAWAELETRSARNAAAAARATRLRARARRVTRRRRRLGSRRRARIRCEAHLRNLTVAGVLDLEELPLREPERVGQDHGREGLDRVVERQHRV